MNVPRKRRYPMRPVPEPVIPTCDNCGRPTNDYWHTYRGCPVVKGIWQQRMEVAGSGTYTFPIQSIWSHPSVIAASKQLDEAFIRGFPDGVPQG